MATQWKEEIKRRAPDLYKLYARNDYMLAAIALFTLPRTPELEAELSETFRRATGGRRDMVATLRAMEQLQQLGRPPAPPQPRPQPPRPAEPEGPKPTTFSEVRSSLLNVKTRAQTQVQTIEQMLNPGGQARFGIGDVTQKIRAQKEGEDNLFDYHRQVMDNDIYSRGSDGRIVSARTVGLKVPEGPHSGKYVLLPSYIPGRGVVRDAGTLWGLWRDEVGRGRFPIYDTPNEMVAASSNIAARIKEDNERRFQVSTSDPALDTEPVIDRILGHGVASNTARMRGVPGLDLSNPQKLPPEIAKHVPPEFRKVGAPLFRLAQWANKHGFTITSGYATTGHNVGSKHYKGLAIDVRTSDKTPEEVERFIAASRQAGFKVVDERTRPKGQNVWSGPHLHLEWAGDPISGKPGDPPLRRFAYLRRQIAAHAKQQLFPVGPTPWEEWSAKMSGLQRFLAGARAIRTKLDGLLGFLQTPAGRILDQRAIVAGFNSELEKIGLPIHLTDLEAGSLTKLDTSLEQLIARASEMHAKLAAKPPKRTAVDKANWLGWEKPAPKDAEFLWAGEVVYGTGEKAGAADIITKGAAGFVNPLYGPAQVFVPEDARLPAHNPFKALFNLAVDATGYVFYGASKESTLDLAPLRLLTMKWEGLGMEGTPKNVDPQILKRYAVTYKQITGKDVEPTVEALREAALEILREPTGPNAVPLWDMSHGPVEITGDANSRWYRGLNALTIGIPGVVTGLYVSRPVQLDREYHPGILEDTFFYTIDAVGTLAMLVATGGISAGARAAGAAAAKTAEKIAAKAVPRALAIKNPVARAAAIRTTGLVVNNILSKEGIENATKLGLFFGVQEASEELTQQLGQGVFDIVPILQSGASAFILGAATGVVGSRLAGIAPHLTLASRGVVPLGTSRWALSFAGETATYATLMPTLSSWASPEGFHFVGPSKEDWLSAFAMTGLSRFLGRATDYPHLVSTLEARLADSAARRMAGQESDFHTLAEEIAMELPQSERVGFVKRLRQSVGIVLTRNFVKNAFANMRTYANRMYREDEAAVEDKAAAREAALAWYAANVRGPLPRDVEQWMLRHRMAQAPAKPPPETVDVDNSYRARNMREARLWLENGYDLAAEQRLLENIQNPLIRKELEAMGVDTETLVARAKMLGIWQNHHIPFAIHDAEEFKRMAGAFERATGLTLTDLLVEGDHIIVQDKINVEELMGAKVRGRKKDSATAKPGVYRWDGKGYLHYVGPTSLPEVEMSKVIWNLAMEQMARDDAQAIIDKAKEEAGIPQEVEPTEEGVPVTGEAEASDVAGREAGVPHPEAGAPTGDVLGPEAADLSPGGEAPTMLGPEEGVLSPEGEVPTGAEPVLEPGAETEIAPGATTEAEVGPTTEVAPTTTEAAVARAGAEPELETVTGPREALRRVQAEAAEQEGRITEMESEIARLEEESDPGRHLPPPVVMEGMTLREQEAAIAEAGRKATEAEREAKRLERKLKAAREHVKRLRGVEASLDKEVRQTERSERKEQMAAHGALRKEAAAAKSNYGKSLRELRRLAGKTKTARKALERAFGRSGFKLRQAMDLVEAAEKATMELDEGPELDALKKALDEYLSLADSLEEAKKAAERDLEDYDKAWADYEASSREVGAPLMESLRPPQEDQISDAMETPSARAARVPNQVLEEPAPKPKKKKGPAREEAAEEKPAKEKKKKEAEPARKARKEPEAEPAPEKERPGKAKATEKKKKKTKEEAPSAEEKERAVFALLDKLASKARAGAEAPVEQPKEARKGKAKPKDARETKAKPKKADAKKVSDAVKNAGKKGSVESKLAADDAKGRPLESDQGIGDKDIHC